MCPNLIKKIINNKKIKNNKKLLKEKFISFEQIIVFESITILLTTFKYRWKEEATYESKAIIDFHLDNKRRGKKKANTNLKSRVIGEL